MGNLLPVVQNQLLHKISIIDKYILPKPNDRQQQVCSNSTYFKFRPTLVVINK